MITFVVGPTAAGKSTWALKEAQRLNAIILNADSIQVYKHFDVGSAKPSVEDRTRVQHELYDLVSPDQEFTAGDYRRAALAIIEREARGREIFVVGGSGFYIQALERGMYDIPPVTDEIRVQVDRWQATQELWLQLERIDPLTANKLSPRDHYRLRRALEATLASGRPWSEIAQDLKQNSNRLAARFEVRKLGISLERSRLRERIVERIVTMLKDGLLDEVNSLIHRGYGETRPFGSVGYFECKEHLAGRLSGDHLVDSIVTSTMQLAKKQMTWFRRDNEITWQEV